MPSRRFARKAALAGQEGQRSANIAAAKTLIQQTRNTTAQFVSDNAKALAEALNKRDNIQHSLIKASAKVRHTRLSVPISGTVQQLSVTTIGQVVASGQQLMTIVPQRSGLEIQALVLNQDIGFVHAGQSAVIKIDSFPFTRYGTISGKVESVSRDAVESDDPGLSNDTQDRPVSVQSSAAAPVSKTRNLVFPVTIVMDRAVIEADGKAVPLSPGMTASVEIQTGRRRVLDYVLSPLREVSSDAGHER
jgi:hemolysin D